MTPEEVLAEVALVLAEVDEVLALALVVDVLALVADVPLVEKPPLPVVPPE